MEVLLYILIDKENSIINLIKLLKMIVKHLQVGHCIANAMSWIFNQIMECSI